MNPRLILLLVAATGMVGASEPEEATSMRSTLAALIRKQVSYQPPAPKAPAEAVSPAPNDEMVVLKPFTVTTPLDGFAHKIDEQQQKFLRGKFTLTEGGPFTKKEGRTFTTEFKLKFEPTHGGWDILSISW